MPNTFEEQAQGRFGKSTAFLSKAQTLLQDDLVARTVLADAVSAIKNALQGYLLIKAGRSPNDSRVQYWQEVAASNRMPELINTCIDAGLDIRHLARDIRRLNDERNYRTHDDPHARIDVEHARRALNLARDVAQRVNAAVKGRSPVPMPAPVVPAPTNGRVPLHNGANGRAAGYESAAERRSVPVATTTAEREVTPTPAPVAPSPLAVPASEEATEDDETPASDDTGIFTTLTPRATRGRGRLARGAIAAALLAAGAAAGLGLAVPLARGSQPSWLSFAHGWYAASGAHLSPAPSSATAPLVPSTVAQSAGDLTASAPTCQAGRAALQLQNTGYAPLPWALSAPASDGAVTFALAASAAPQPSALGTLAAEAKTTLYAASTASGPYRILLVGPGGALELIAPAC